MTFVPSHAEDTCLKNRTFTDCTAGFGPTAAHDDDCDGFVHSSRRGHGFETSDLVSEKPLISQETLCTCQHDDSENKHEREKGEALMEHEKGPALALSGSSTDPGEAEHGQAGQERVATTPSFPEGGVEAWLVVFGSFCTMFVVFGLINTAGVFESYFATHQLASSSPSQLGWIFSLYLFIVFFVGIQVGPAFDKHGPRMLVAVGSLLSVASLMLVGFCQEYYQIILTYSVVGGLGGALLNSPAYGCVAHFFNARRGLATGIATTAGGVGGIVFPILLQHLLPQLGFAWSTRVLGFMLLVLVLPANLFLRARLSSSPSGSHNPNETVTDGKRQQQQQETSPSTLATVSPRRPSVWPDLRVFRDPCFALCSLGIWFMEWGLFIPLTFIVSYAAAHGQDATSSYMLLALLNGGSVAGRVLPGLLADRLGRFNVIIATIALCTATVLGLWLPAGDSRGMLIAFAVLFGFASGSNLGLIPVCVGQLCEARDYGRYYATAMMLASFGTLSSVPIGGVLLGLGDGRGEVGWTALRVFAGMSYAAALVCYAAARVLAVGWRLKVVF